MAFHTNNIKVELEAPTPAFPNLLVNPNGQFGQTVGWATSNTTLTAGAFLGLTEYQQFYLRANTTSGGYIYSEPAKFSAGQYAGGRFSVGAVDSGTVFSIRVEFLDANWTLTGTGSTGSGSAGGTYYANAAQAPAGTMYARLRIGVFPTTANKGIYFQESMLTKSDATFTNTYPWVDNVTWTDITAPLYEINVSKRELDVSSMTVKLRDTNFDPSTNVQVRKNKRLRLSIKNPQGYQQLWSGKIDEASTVLTRAGMDIEIEAFDSVADLANIMDSRGVATLEDLAALLAGRALFDINGLATLTTPNPTIVSSNENANVLDQVAITRDSNLAYAWVDRKNVLRIYDSAHISQTRAANFTDEKSANLVTVTNLFGDPRATGYNNGIDSPTWRATRWFGPNGTGNYSNHNESGPVELPFDTFVRKTWTNASPTTGTGDSGFDVYGGPTGTLAATPGQTVTASTYLRTNTTGKNGCISVYWWSDGGVLQSRQFSPDVALPSTGDLADRWVRVSGTFTVPSGVTGMSFAFDIAGSSTNWVNGNTLDATGGVITRTNYLTEYFDGYTLGNGWDYSWAGTPNQTVSTRQAILDPMNYSDIDAGFNTRDCINVVDIKWLRYDIGTRQTEEKSYGPYVDQNSVDAYGAMSQTFTIQGSPSNEHEGYIGAFASTILAANSVPKYRVKNVTVPVKDTNSQLRATTLDLYSLVRVFRGNLIKNDLRIRSIEHTITPESWEVTYGFGDTGSVAIPTYTPSPPALVLSGGWTNLPFSDANWQNNPWGYQVPQYRKVADRVELRGIALRNSTSTTAVATLPPGLRPFLGVVTTCVVSDTPRRIDINSDGTVVLGAAANATQWVSLNGVHFYTS